MTPYSLTSIVNQSSSCQAISNHNPGATSAVLKQDNNLHALQARFNYD